MHAADHANADSVFRAAIVAVNQGFLEEALALAQRGVADHPDDPRLWQALGLAHRGLEDMGPAIEAFATAARLAPSDPLIAHSLARSTLEGGLPAVDLFDRALHLAPNDGSVLLGRAAAELAEGRIDQAIDGLERVLAAHCGWVDGHQTVARLLWMGGKQQTFTRSFETALRATPRDVAIWSGLITTLIGAERYDDAQAAVSRARAAVGGDPAFDRFEVICVAERGETEAADRLFAGLGPISDTDLVVRLVRHLLRSGRPAEAAATAEAHLGEEMDDALWPYLSAIWRLTDDPRWQWLEGDDRLVGVYDIGEKVGPLAELAERLRALHLTSHAPLDQTVRGGTQTDGPLFARLDPEVRALRQAIATAVEAHLAQLPAHDPRHPLLREKRAPIRFSGSWSVRLKGAGYHVNHVHPAGWISSAFYVALPEAHMGGADHSGWLSLGEVSELGLDLPPIRLIEPKPGRLVLFPSIMWHGTRPFREGERLTVAFDVGRPTG